MKLRKVEPGTRKHNSLRGTDADGLFDPKEGFIPRAQVNEKLQGKPLSEQKQIRKEYRDAVVWLDVDGTPVGFSPAWLPTDKDVAKVVEVRHEISDDEVEQAVVEAKNSAQKPIEAQTAEERIAELEQKLKTVTNLALKLAQKN